MCANYIRLVQTLYLNRRWRPKPGFKHRFLSVYQQTGNPGEDSSRFRFADDTAIAKSPRLEVSDSTDDAIDWWKAKRFVYAGARVDLQ